MSSSGFRYREETFNNIAEAIDKITYTSTTYADTSNVKAELIGRHLMCIGVNAESTDTLTHKIRQPLVGLENTSFDVSNENIQQVPPSNEATISIYASNTPRTHRFGLSDGSFFNLSGLYTLTYYEGYTYFFSIYTHYMLRCKDYYTSEFFADCTNLHSLYGRIHMFEHITINGTGYWFLTTEGGTLGSNVLIISEDLNSVYFDYQMDKPATRCYYYNKDLGYIITAGNASPYTIYQFNLNVSSPSNVSVVNAGSLGYNPSTCYIMPLGDAIVFGTDENIITYEFPLTTSSTAYNTTTTYKGVSCVHAFAGQLGDAEDDTVLMIGQAFILTLQFKKNDGVYFNMVYILPNRDGTGATQANPTDQAMGGVWIFKDLEDTTGTSYYAADQVYIYHIFYNSDNQMWGVDIMCDFKSSANFGTSKYAFDTTLNRVISHKYTSISNDTGANVVVYWYHLGDSNFNVLYSVINTFMQKVSANDDAESVICGYPSGNNSIITGYYRGGQGLESVSLVKKISGIQGTIRTFQYNKNTKAWYGGTQTGNLYKVVIPDNNPDNMTAQILHSIGNAGAPYWNHSLYDSSGNFIFIQNGWNQYNFNDISSLAYVMKNEVLYTGDTYEGDANISCGALTYIWYEKEANAIYGICSHGYIIQIVFNDALHTYHFEVVRDQSSSDCSFWAVPNDNNTVVWAWAKCDNFHYFVRSRKNETTELDNLIIGFKSLSDGLFEAYNGGHDEAWSYQPDSARGIKNTLYLKEYPSTNPRVFIFEGDETTGYLTFLKTVIPSYSFTLGNNNDSILRLNNCVYTVDYIQQGAAIESGLCLSPYPLVEITLGEGNSTSKQAYLNNVYYVSDV